MTTMKGLRLPFPAKPLHLALPDADAFFDGRVVGPQLSGLHQRIDRGFADTEQLHDLPVIEPLVLLTHAYLPLPHEPRPMSPARISRIDCGPG